MRFLVSNAAFDGMATWLSRIKGVGKNWKARRKARPFRLAVMAIAKNESMNIDEWVSHYLWQGADKIFVIDNGSTDDTREKLATWARSGHLEFVLFEKQHRQIQHYREAFRHFKIRRHFEWLLIADLDEFWFCKDGQSISAALAHADYDVCDVIYANWSIFGSNGYIEHPASLRRCLTLKQPS